jgi:hypothetical protein
MDSVIIGDKHRYHVEDTIATTDKGSIYRVFTRRRSGNVIKRRYYAAIVAEKGVDLVDFQTIMQKAINTIDYPVHEEDCFDVDGLRCVVIGKGEPHKKNSRFAAFYNKGYLMIILSVLILILIIARSCRQSPQPVPAANPDEEVFEESNVI